MKEKRRILWYRFRKVGVVVLCSVIFFTGAYLANQKSISVSNTVNGRQLPVYCVQTEKKQVALTFDAACPDGKMRL